MKILKSIAKWLLLAWAIVGIVIAGLWLLNAPEDLAQNSESKARLDEANYSVGEVDLKFSDATRLTPAGDFALLSGKSTAATTKPIRARYSTRCVLSLL